MARQMDQVVKPERLRQEELIKKLRARKGSSDVDNMLELLRLQFEGVKSNLVTCSPEEFLYLQGEARGHDKLIRMLGRTNIGETT